MLWFYCYIHSYEDSTNQRVSSRIVKEVRGIHGKKKWERATIKGNDVIQFSIAISSYKRKPNHKVYRRIKVLQSS